MKAAYLGPLTDYSGYGEANRHDIAALDAAGVEVNAMTVSYVRERADFGTMESLVDRLNKNDFDYNIKILHTTPDQYPRYIEDGKYHIGRVFWETDKFPAGFMKGINMMDEVWTGSKANSNALRNSGYERPIYIIPQAIEINREPVQKYLIPGFPEDGYLFYSIFEWTDRKNPEALIRAYMSEFTADDSVGLLLKTYFHRFTKQNALEIRRKIEKIKAEFQSPPPVFLYTHLMDREQVQRVHKTGDCFVSAHRGEGWGIPQVEALLAKNPIISTPYGGCHEYLHGSPDVYWPEYDMVQVRPMDHSEWYKSDQKWAEIRIDTLRADMRAAFDKKHRDAAIGQRRVMDDFNFKIVGDLMAKRLEEIKA